MNCKYCGVYLNEEEEFCKGCGTKTIHAMPLEALARMPEDTKKKSGLIAAISVAAAFVLVFGLLIAEWQLSIVGLFGSAEPAITETYNDPTEPESETSSEAPTEYTNPDFPATPAYFYTTANLHLRAGPSTNTNSLELVPFGTRVQVIAYANAEWFRVRHNGRNGYMSAEFLNETPRMSVASLWNANLSTIRRVLGDPIRTTTEFNHMDGGYDTIYTFNYGVVIVSAGRQEQQAANFSVRHLNIEFNARNRTRFHYRGVDGTATQEDIITTLGQPPHDDDGQQLGGYWFGEDGAFIRFDMHNNTVSTIRIFFPV